MSSSATQRRACARKRLSPELMEFILTNPRTLATRSRSPALAGMGNQHLNVRRKRPSLFRVFLYNHFEDVGQLSPCFIWTFTNRVAPGDSRDISNKGSIIIWSRDNCVIFQIPHTIPPSLPRFVGVEGEPLRLVLCF